jgi:CRP-like cAMP-binding protein
VSPRHVPATAHELSRAGLLASLPGERLSGLAERMERRELPPGSVVVQEGDPGDRFYVVLSGVLEVTQATLGRRGMLKPGDHFGEVALAVGVPRTATVRAVTPVTLASCDRATFDEYLRPLFADED